MYSYDKPLHSMKALAASVKFPGSAIGDMSADKSRILNGMVILGVLGIVATAADVTIVFTDDSAVPVTLGTFTALAADQTVGKPLVGKLVLTEAGYQIGVEAPTVVTATVTGLANVTDGQIIVGYF